jgi:hypothetical protein
MNEEELRAWRLRHPLLGWFDDWPKSPDDRTPNPHDPYYSDIEEHEHVTLTCTRCKQQFTHKCEEVRE